MDHEPVLISTIAIGLTAAFIGGFVARRLGLPAIVGYIVAGIAIGPFTPGLVADPSIATELAEIGVILLMFGVGIHFSFRDLLAVRRDRRSRARSSRSPSRRSSGPGSASSSAAASAAGSSSASRSPSRAPSCCCAPSRTATSSTRQQGRIAVGWLIVEDLFTVVVLVLLPLDRADARCAPSAEHGAGPRVDRRRRPRRGRSSPSRKAAIFAVLMVVAGARVIPWLLLQVARQGSRELFTLAVLAIALGIAYAASTVFGVSFALGAFLAGLVVERVGHEPSGGRRRAAAARRLRRAVLRVGRDAARPGCTCSRTRSPVLAMVVVLIVLAQPLAAFGIVVAFGYPTRVALTVAAALGQIGEFSFILGTLGLTTRAAAGRRASSSSWRGRCCRSRSTRCSSRSSSPSIDGFATMPLFARLDRRRTGDLATIGEERRATLVNHAVICGYGRVGRADRARSRAAWLQIRRHHAAARRGRSASRGRASPRSTATRPRPRSSRWPGVASARLVSSRRRNRTRHA